MRHPKAYLIITSSVVFSLGLKGLAQEKPASVPVNTLASEWEVSDWLNSPPLKLGDLRGKVVLIRWWTGPGCPFCINSAGSLNQLYHDYSDDGLVVIGLYHHKSYLPLDEKKVREYSDTMGFQFPVAIDHDWETLKKWWLYGPGRSYTSVSFLIDKNGVIRYIHPGGQFVIGDADYGEIKSTIEKNIRDSDHLS